MSCQPLTRSQIQPEAKAALEVHPLFTGGRVPVLTKYFSPGQPNDEREEELREHGAVIEISPVLKEKLFKYSRPTQLVKDCTFSVAVRIRPNKSPGDAPLLPLTLDTMVDAVQAALLGLGFTLSVPFNDVKPEDELSQLIEDEPGLLSTAIFFTARCYVSASAQ